MANEIELDLNDGASVIAAKKTIKPLSPLPVVDEIDVEYLQNTTSAIEVALLVAEKPAITEGLLEFGIEVDASIEDLIALAVQDGSSAMYLAVRSGMAFMAAQERLNNGECAGRTPVFFKDFIQELGYSKERAYENIRLAKGYLNIPANQRKGFIALGKKKAMRLSALEPDQINELIEQNPDALDEFALMSRDELKKQLQKFASHADTFRNERDDLQSKVNALTRTQVPGDGEFDVRTFEVRYEASALEYGARSYLDDIETLLNQVLGEQSDMAMQSLRLRSVGLAIGGAFARALVLFDLAREALGEDMPVQPHGDLILSDAEKLRLDAGLTIIRENAKRMKGERADEVIRQDNAHRKGPGRRRGSTNN